MKAHRPWPCYTSLRKEQLAFMQDLAKAGRNARKGNWSGFSKWQKAANAHLAKINRKDMFDKADRRCYTKPRKRG
jgi:hypothetical protein